MAILNFSVTEYLIRTPDCNLHSLNAETDQNLFQSIFYCDVYVTVTMINKTNE